MVENLAHALSSRGQSTEQYRAPTVARHPLANIHRPLARARPAGFDEYTLRELARVCDYDAQRISQHFGISLRHLQRWFNAHFASTPCVWLAEQRLLHARELLALSSSVKEVAYALGFNHVSHFSRDFRRRFGHRPSAELKRRRVCEALSPPIQFSAEQSITFEAFESSTGSEAALADGSECICLEPRGQRRMTQRPAVLAVGR